MYRQIVKSVLVSVCFLTSIALFSAEKSEEVTLLDSLAFAEISGNFKLLKDSAARLSQIKLEDKVRALRRLTTLLQEPALVPESQRDAVIDVNRSILAAIAKIGPTDRGYVQWVVESYVKGQKLGLYGTAGDILTLLRFIASSLENHLIQYLESKKLHERLAAIYILHGRSALASRIEDSLRYITENLKIRSRTLWVFQTFVELDAPNLKKDLTQLLSFYERAIEASRASLEKPASLRPGIIDLVQFGEAMAAVETNNSKLVALLGEFLLISHNARNPITRLEDGRVVEAIYFAKNGKWSREDKALEAKKQAEKLLKLLQLTEWKTIRIRTLDDIVANLNNCEELDQKDVIREVAETVPLNFLEAFVKVVAKKGTPNLIKSMNSIERCEIVFRQSFPDQKTLNEEGPDF